MGPSNSITEERLSLKEVINRFRGLVAYLIGQWKLIGAVAVGFASLVSVYSFFIKDVEYSAETTFVVQSGGKGVNNDVSSLASAVGISLGGLGQSSSLFNSENILKLTSSYRLMRKTFLEIDTFDTAPQRLITRYITEKEILQKWQKDLPDFTYEVPLEQMTVEHDSLLKLVLEKFNKQLVAEKVDRRLDILSIKVTDTDERFAKIFNEALVKNVNEFYIETKTLKTGENLKILHKQADSVKQVLDQALIDYGLESQRVPNPNAIKYNALVGAQKLEIDLQVAAAVYQEVLKQLEVAKITHQTNTPIVQVVDEPIYPLENSEPKVLKLIIINLILGGAMCVAFLVGKKTYQFIMSHE